MDEIKLKPCPFCGKEPKLQPQEIYPNGEKSPAYAFCRECHVAKASYDGDKQAVEIWNTRPIEDAQAQRIAELETKITDLLHQEINPWIRCADLLPEFGVEVEVYAAPFYARGKRTEYPDRVLWGCGFEPTHWREIVLPK